MKKHIIGFILTFALMLSLCGSGFAAGASFPDIEGHWAENEITVLAAQNIIRGFPDGTVRPEQTISRAEFAVLTARLFGYKGSDEPAPFDDLAGYWAEPEISALTAAGIIKTAEYGGSFEPAKFITRAEMVRILVRAIDGGINCANDEDCAKAAMQYGVLKGYADGSLGLDKSATRAEVFAMLLRAQTAKAGCDKNAEEKKPVSNVGGGSYTPPIPAAEISFALPETAYVGESAVVTAAVTGTAGIDWKLLVNNAEAALPEDFKGIGGELAFPETGTYTLTGTAKNSAGRETACTHTVNVYPVAALALELPAAAHTDEAIEAVLSGERYSLPVVWTLTKNGETAELSECSERTLSDTGGRIRFTGKGVYRLTATATDALGRAFSASADVTVYPVGQIGVYLPEIFHTDDTVNAAASFSNYDNSPVTWTLEHDGKTVSLSDYVSGGLTADGGSIRVTKAGSYSITAAYTDAGGRSYSYSQSFTVYPVPTLSFAFDSTAHTDSAVTVKTTSTELDGLTVNWLVDNTRYAEGETVREIVESLNARGLQTKRNKPYNMNSFNAILKNRKYIGEYKYQDVIIPDGVPAIVPLELFDRVQARMEKNKRAPAMSKAEDDYLLTTKLFCGKCGRLMVGESGTSHTGKKHYYYKCGSAKRKTGCSKRAVKKDWIENLVVSRTMQMIFDDSTLSDIADMILDVQEWENTSLPVLKEQLSQAEQGIQNMLNAIQQGILTPATKQRLDELEETKERLTVSILQEELQKPRLTEEQITFWLRRFRTIDTTKQEQRQRLIDSFVNAVYVYEDKIILTFNYKDGTDTITLDDINGSDLEASAPPSKK